MNKLTFPSRQKGFILMTTLILMIMLTVLAVSQVSQNSTQTRLAANATDSEISFEKSEGALNEAINKILNHSYSSKNFLNNDNGLYIFNNNEAPIWTTVNWDSNAVVNSFQGSTSTRARYVIEQLPSVVQPGQSMKSATKVFRITSRSVGANGNTSVRLQSTIQTQQ